MNDTTCKFQVIIEKLTPKTQAYLLNLANMASVAEQSAKEEMKREEKRCECQ